MLTPLKLMAAAVAVAAVVSVPAARAQQFINVLTGGTSGVYYPLGVAIGKIYSDKIPGVKTQVQATKASVENLILLQQGRGEIAFTLGDSLKAAWDGNRRQRHQDAGRSQGQESLGRRAKIGHRTQRARDPRRRRVELPGYRQG
jgi:TRAP transporter TAXI family solute receptor